MLSNAYFLAKFRFDTAENEPARERARAQKEASRGLVKEEAWRIPGRRRLRPGAGAPGASGLRITGCCCCGSKLDLTPS